MTQGAAGRLDFLGRAVTGPELLAGAGPLGGGLAAALPAGARVLLFLPNTPSWVGGLLAVLGAGLQPQLVDPRRPLDELAAQLAAEPPALIVTLDIAAVLDKLLRLLPGLPEVEVRVARFAPQLPFPRNLLFPLLRGGGLANLPDAPRFARLERLQGPAPDPAAAWSGPLLLPGGPVAQAPLAAEAGLLTTQAAPGERWLLAAPLASRNGLSALFAALAGEVTLLLSPRLDARSLDKLERQSAATRRIEAEAA